MRLRMFPAYEKAAIALWRTPCERVAVVTDEF
jgi:hypothetical protein